MKQAQKAVFCLQNAESCAIIPEDFSVSCPVLHDFVPNFPASRGEVELE